MKTDCEEDPKNCPEIETWGQRIAFVSPFCPHSQPVRSGWMVPKARCAQCWEEQLRKKKADAARRG